MNLGKRIQELRRKRGLTTGELAAQVHVTSGFISQLEHGKTDPSLHTLQRVAIALEVPLSSLLIEENRKPQVVRKQDRHVVHLGNTDIQAAILSPLPSRSLELVLLYLPPGKETWTKQRAHEGQECHLILKGTVRAYYAEESYLLEEGDSILWDGIAPHRLENIGRDEVQILIALSPPTFLPLETAAEPMVSLGRKH
jgi:transcriptional regulator with XRE-family HTH domain